MKALRFVGTVLEDLKQFLIKVRRAVSFELFNIQCGLMPSDFKSMLQVGASAYELRMRISRRNWTHQQAAMQLGIEPERLSDLIRGQEEQFNIDMLITLATRAGCRVELELLPA